MVHYGQKVSNLELKHKLKIIDLCKFKSLVPKKFYKDY